MADVREQEAPPVGEQVHMPEPSLLPVLNAAGLAAAIIGITISPVLIVGGGVLFIVTAIKWARDTRRDIDALPLDHDH
jgi:hypothetical protein